jgi:hypothetical protein
MVTGLAGFQLRKRTEATGRGKVGEEEHSANRTDEPHRCFLFLADVVFSSDTPFLPFLLRGNFLCNKREKIWMEKYIDDFFYRYTLEPTFRDPGNFFFFLESAF